MSIRRLTRPDRHPDQIRDFIRHLFIHLDTLGVSAGEDFLISSTEASELQSHDENATGGTRRSDPDTSRKAALQNMPRSGSQRHKALVAIVDAGAGGLTGHQVAEVTGIEYRSITPRLRELKDGGWIEDATFTRKTNLNAEAHVLIATEKGRREVTQDLGYREEAML